MDPLDTMWFRLLAGMLVGLALGSFVTMLSYRAPRNLSIISPPSHCPHCRTPLKMRDLVPLFSWLSESGKCRHCAKPISFRYVFIEVVTGIACTIAFVIFGFKPELLVALIGIVTFVTLVTINIERGKS